LKRGKHSAIFRKLGPGAPNIHTREAETDLVGGPREGVGGKGNVGRGV